ncbi:MAG: tRNA (adenosine(37)-N6)-threonylcarbamoyltransferase complex dimerization subunit type 1 TsaB [Clostridia bacterium]|nr:tRNA (adenosine(37)-N6)-threonylcarbamoyltransferase complex dimerization subunit type 1 TsaB [Clostridia bacterium]
MNILAIDTTTKKANVALKTNNEIVINSIDNEITHSEKLLPLIDKTLKDNLVNLKDIECLACTTGPGSFTGIRIGLATAKAIAKVTNAKIFAIDSLELLAHSSLNNIKAETNIIVSLIDAKNTRAYCRFYSYKNSTIYPICDATNKYISDIILEVQDKFPAENVLYILDNENLIDLINSDNYVIASLDMHFLIALANKATDFENHLTLDATYVRNSEAERTKYGE